MATHELITHSRLMLPACLWVEVWWLTRSDLVTSQLFIYHKKQQTHLQFPALVQLNFLTNTLLLLAISFCDKDFSDKLQSWLHVENISNKKNNQKEHLSLFHRGSNTVLNATNFLQKRGVWINILTPSIQKLIILVINVGNNWPN